MMNQTSGQKVEGLVVENPIIYKGFYTSKGRLALGFLKHQQVFAIYFHEFEVFVGM